MNYRAFANLLGGLDNKAIICYYATGSTESPYT
jgi:hypothetical protein